MNASTNRILYVLCAVAFVVIIARAYMNVKGTEDFVVTVTQPEVQAFARARLDELQERSFSENIELCGIIFERSDGSLGSSNPRPGSEASCGISYFDEPGMRPVASYHTHGGQNEAYDSEVPSTLDMEGDAASGMDGYVATPGGRFWHIDAKGPIANLVCGAGCLAQDPKYEPCPALNPQQRYTLPELAARQGGTYFGC